MVAIVTGTGFGIARNSAALLGTQGQLGAPETGSGNDRVYVNAANGNLVIDRVDDVLTGVGPDEAYSLTYNSEDPSTLVGIPMAWNLGTYHRLTNISGTVNAAGSTVTRIDRDGSSTLFTYDSTKACYTSQDGPGATNELRFASGAWTWTDGTSRTTETYGSIIGQYFLTAVTDADGNSQAYSYNANGTLDRITEANGDYMAVSWYGAKPSGVTTSYTNASGIQTLTRIRYTWDNYRLITATVDLSPQDNNVADGNSYTTTYGYDGSSMRVASISQSDGSRLDITYVQVGSDYRVQSTVQTVATGVTRTTTYAYDLANRITTVTDSGGQQTQLWYDANGQLTKIVSPPATPGAAAAVQTFAYNPAGDVTSRTDPNGNATTYSYDASGNMIYSRDAQGNYIARTYDSRNQLLSEAHGVDRSVIAAPAVADASFEAPGLGNAAFQYNPAAAGVSFLGGAGIANNGSAWNFPAAPAGAQVAFIQGDGSIVQTVTGLTAGSLYQVNFLMSGRPGFVRAPVTVSADSAVLGTYTAAGYSFTGITTATFQATSDTATITFHGALANGGGWDRDAGIDSVSVTRAAPPVAMIADSSFEAPEISGYSYNPWAAETSFNGQSGVAANGSAWNFTTPPDGNQVAFLQGSGSVALQVDGLLPGASYQLKFQLAARSGYPAAPIVVSLAGQVLGTYTPSSTGFVEFTTPAFTATAASEALTFAAAAPDATYCAGLDKVSIVAMTPQAPVATDGSFESPAIGSNYAVRPTAAGLTFAGLAGIAGNGSAFGFTAAADGVQAGWLQGSGGQNGTISVALSNVVAGKHYRAAFYLAQRPGYGANTLSVSVDQASLGSFTPTSTSFGRYVSASFTAGASSATLTFTGAATSAETDDAIDGITIVDDDTPAATIVDSSFEAPGIGNGYVYNPANTGASFIGGAGVAGNGSAWGFAAAPQGTQVAFIQGAGTITLPVSNLVAGKSYTATFMLARRPGFGADPITVSAGGTVLGTYAPAGNGFTQFTTAAFLAADSSTALTFTGITSPNDISSALDQVVLTPVIQPGTPADRYAYDSNSNLRFEVSPEGRVTEHRYNALGQEVATLVYTGSVFDTSWLDFTDTLSETALAAWAAAVADKTTIERTDTTYDSRGNVNAVTHYSKCLSDGSGDAVSVATRETYVYDPAGNLLSRSTATGVGAALTESYVYDGLGRKLLTTDAAGARTSTVFDDAHQKVVVTLASGLQQTSVYDLAGERISYSEAQSNLLPNASLANGTQGWQLSGVTRVAGAPGDPLPYYFQGNGSVTTAYGPAPSGSTFYLSYQAKPAVAGQQFQAGILWYDSAGNCIGNPVVNAWPPDSTKLATYEGQVARPANAAFYYIYVSGNGTFGGVRMAETPVLPSTPTTDLDRIDPLNLMPNASLLDGTRGWQLSGLTRTAGGPGDPLPYYFQGSGSATTAYGPAPTGTTFYVSYQAKPAVAGQQFQAGILWYDSAGNCIGNPVVNAWPPDTTKMTTYEGQVTRPANAAFYYLYIAGTGTFGGVRMAEAPLSSVGSAAATTVSRYDALGRLRVETDPTGRQTYYLYDNVGRKTAEITADSGPDPVNVLPDLDGVQGWQLSGVAPVAGGAADPLPVYVAGNGSATTAYGPAPSGSTLYLSYQAKPAVAGQQFQAGILWYDSAGNCIGNPVVNAWPTDTTRMATYEGQVARPANAAFYYVYVAGNGTFGGARLAETPVASPAAASAPSARGRMTEFVYDSGGRLSTTISYTHKLSAAQFASLLDAAGNPSSVAVSDVRPLAGTLDAREWRVYDHADRLVETIDAAGRATTFAYDASSRLVATTSYATALTPQVVMGLRAAPPTAPVLPPAAAADRTERSFYDKDGQVVGTLDGTGAVTQLFYDGAGRKVREIAYARAVDGGVRSGTFAQILGNVDVAGQTNRRTDYVYDDRGLVRFTIDATGRPTELVYDPAGRAIRTIDYAGSVPGGASYSLASMETWAAGAAGDALNRVARSVYDDAGHLAYAIDAEGGTAAYSYDQAGRTVKETRFATPFAAAGDQSLAAMQSWASGHAADAGNRVSRTLYDAAGRAVYEVDPEGFITEHRYDLAGRVTQDIRYAANYAVADAITNIGLSVLIGAAPAGAVTVAYAYDAEGRLTDVIDGTGVTTHFLLDALGQAVDTTVAYGTADAATVHRAYDAAGRVTAETHAWGTADAAKTAYAYDAVGNVLAETDARGNIVTRTYDSMGRVLTETRPLDAVTSAVTSYSYDAFGHVARTIDARGNATFSYYDRLGRLTLEVDAEGYATETAYTPFGQVATVTRRAAATSGTPAIGVPPQVNQGPGDATTQFAYDRLGRLTRVTDAEGAYESYQLNAFGDRIQVRNKLGGLTANAYDRRGLLTSETLPVGSYNAAGALVAANVVNRFEYDARGNRTKTIEASGLAEQRATLYAYDKLDRLVQTTHDAVAVRNADLSRTTVIPTETIVYDRRGNVILTTDATGGRTFLYYDAADRKVASVDAAGTLSRWTYDGNGNVLTARVYGDAVPAPAAAGGVPPSPVNAANYRETLYGYDRANRLVTTMVAAVTTGEDLGGGYYAGTGAITTETVYDAAGNAVRQIDARGNSIWSWYDRLGRKVAQVDGENYLTTWARDSEGNVTSETRYANRIAAGDVLPYVFQQASAGANGYAETAMTPLPAGTTSLSFSYRFKPGYAGQQFQTSLIWYDDNGNNVAGTWASNDFPGDTTSFARLQANIAVPAGATRFILYTLAVGGGGGLAQFGDYQLVGNGEGVANGQLLAGTSGWNVTNAQRVAGAFTPATSVAALQALAGTSADDRTTTFSYDHDGRRTDEYRLNVASATVAADGSFTAATATSHVHYSYNGLGEVTAKTEASQETTAYQYDLGGRQVSVAGPAFTDYAGAAAQRLTANLYDGLGDLVRTVVGNGLSSDHSADRAATYAYGAGGRLATMTDAAGFARSYDYDAAGRTVMESWVRVRSDGSQAVEANVTRYDAAGRVVGQGGAVAPSIAGAWSLSGDQSQIRYDAYGEVAAKGMNGLWQETFEYDKAGRLWRSTAEDGTAKVFLADRAGNSTLAITSTGANLAAYADAASVLSLFTNNGAYAVGATAVAGAVATIVRFDRRGLGVSERDPLRQLDGATTATVSSSRAYNAFGEAASETDARGYTTNYSYNTMGRLIQKQSPTVSWTSESGAVASARPTENYYYDLAGRLVASDDANGNRTKRLLLAGTGYGGADASVVKEFHADGGVVQTGYDAFGDARTLVDELNRAEYRSYDAMDRLVSVAHRGGLLTDTYAYDGLGRRIRHANTVYGGAVERTDYDLAGRVVLQTDLTGAGTSYAYAWNGAIATAGLGTFGGWVKTTVNGAGLSACDSLDYFGRTVSRSDLGGHGFSYGYNAAGQLVSMSSSAGASVGYAYFNTGRLSQVTDNAGSGYDVLTSTYGYDAAGNRTYEGVSGTVYSYYLPSGTTAASASLQSTSATYDALGRIATIIDLDGGGNLRSSSTTSYDLAGNIRHVASSNVNLAYPQYGQQPKDLWYRYDSMNRMVVADGNLSNGTIVAGVLGAAMTYDLAGERRTMTHDAGLTGYAYVWVPDQSGGTVPREIDPGGGEGGHYEYQAVGYYGQRREEYTYRDDGYLSQVRIAETGYVDNGDGTVSATDMGASVLRGDYQRDALGRVTEERQWDTNAQVSSDRYAISYDAANLVLSETVSQLKLESGHLYTYVSTTTNGYNPGGVLASSSVHSTKAGYGIQADYAHQDAAAPDTYTSNSYTWWDDARLNVSSFNPNTSYSTTQNSTYAYDGEGRIAYVDIADGRRRTVSFASAAGGQVLQRTERSATAANPEDHYGFLDGRQVAFVTNNGNNDPARMDYSQGIRTAEEWSTATGSANQSFRWGTTGGVTDSLLGPGAGYDPINPATGAGSNARYTVQAGDTLQGIASAVWGDASLWYLIADANGMSGAEALQAGQTLTVPGKVTNIHNSAATFRVYDPNKALGDLSPTAPKPAKGHQGGCGVVGVVLLVAIAVAVTVVTSGAFAAAAASAVTGGSSVGIGAGISMAFGGSAIVGGMSVSLTAAGMVAAGAIGAAAGSIVSQGIGVATGLQDKFSWKDVALAAISGGVGGGVAQIPGLSGASGLGAVLQGSARGVIASSVTQGIAVATGLQSKFDWTGVAAAGVSGGVSAAVGQALHVEGFDRNNTLTNHINGSAMSMAGAIANAATRSVIDGTDFGDNIIAALPDVLGQTLGNMIAFGVSGPARAGNPDGLVHEASQGASVEAAGPRGSLEGALPPPPPSFDISLEGMGVFGAAPEDMPGQGWNPFREFGENMFAQAERFRVRVARDLSNAPNAAINLALDGLRDNTCRALTAGEAAAAGGAFRGRLDLSDVRLCDGPAHNPDARFVLLLVGRPAITEGNTVFVRHDLFKADFSRAGSQAIGLILHELTHVVQYQSLGILGFAHRYVDELRDSGFDQDKLYNYEPGKSRFVSSTLEAQAQMVEDYSRATNATIRSKIARSLRGSGMFGL